MKTVAIFTNGDFPIPAVSGGSAAVHIEYLLKYNELNPTMNFVVISKYDPKAKAESSSYKYTKFIYIDKKSIIFRLINGVRHNIDKIHRHFSDVIVESGFFSESVRLLKKYKIQFDAILIKDRLNAATYIKESFPNHKIYSCAEWDYLNSELYEKKPGQVKAVLKNTDTFICVSDFIKNQINNIPIRQEYPCDNVTCYNGLNPDLFNKPVSEKEKIELRTKLGIGADEFVILYTGRLIEVKGVLELLKAYLPIHQKAKLVILGSADYAKLKKTEYIRNLFELANQSENIRFTGHVNYFEIYKYYKISNVIVLPSLWEEAFNLSLLEGMLCKVPVIITRSGGMPEIPTEKGAIILERNESLIENIRDSIERIIENPDSVKGMVDFAYNRAMDFTEKIFCKNMINILSGNHENCK